MDGIETKVYKSLYIGWMAESRIPMGADRALKITTCKRSGGRIETWARAVKVEGDMESFLMVGDYSCTIGIHTARATEKNVRALHSEAVSSAPWVLKEASAFYAAKGVV